MNIQTTQAALPFAPTIQDRFTAFHERHPQVLVYLVSLCRDLRSRGIQHYGIRSLWERARWHFEIERTVEFKLNDQYTSRYARLIVEIHPEMEGFFELRKLRAQ